jgi:hypothetical protein
METELSLDRPTLERAALELCRGRAEERQRGLEMLYRMHRGILIKMARRMRRLAPQNDEEDYLQEAHIAAGEAADSYDAGRGTKFTTWLGIITRNRLQNLACSGVIYAPRTDYCNKKKVMRAESGRRLLVARGAARMGGGNYEFSGLRELTTYDRGPVAVDMADEWAAFERQVERVLAHRIGLGQRRTAIWRTVITLRVRGYKWAVIGGLVGLSKQRVLQIWQKFITLAAGYPWGAQNGREE